MQLIDFIVFIAFTLGVVVFGCSFFKKGSSADEFTSAGHSIPGWVVGMSIFATYVSSISYIGYPGKAFAADWNAFVFSLSIPIASYFAAKYFVPFYRHSGSVSAYTFLEEKFGVWARLYASACYLLTQIARMGSILYLLAVPMYILMGWDMHTVIILTSIGIIIYSMMGGLKAVIWADAIQGIILIGGAVLCLAILMFSMPEGPMQVLAGCLYVRPDHIDVLGMSHLRYFYQPPELWYRPKLCATLPCSKDGQGREVFGTLRRLSLYPCLGVVLSYRLGTLLVLSGRCGTLASRDSG